MSLFNQGSWTDNSGTIAAGDAAQTLLAANKKRRGWMVQNLHATEALYINFTIDAVEDQPSVRVDPGIAYSESIPNAMTTEKISIIAHTTGHKFVCKELS